MARDEDDVWGDLTPRRVLVGIDRDPHIVSALQDLFSEDGHVFQCHPDGHWSIQDGDKDRYARDLLAIVTDKPGLVARLLGTDNRLVKMITYRAIELAKSADADCRK